MQRTNPISSIQLSRIWTMYSPATIRDFAKKGKLPVVRWNCHEPAFANDTRTIRAMLNLVKRHA